MNKEMLLLVLFTTTIYAADDSNAVRKNRLSDSKEFYENLGQQPMQSEDTIKQMVQEVLGVSDTIIHEAERDPLVTALLNLAKNSCQTESEEKACLTVYGTGLHLKINEQLNRNYTIVQVLLFAT